MNFFNLVISVNVKGTLMCLPINELRIELF